MDLEEGRIDAVVVAKTTAALFHGIREQRVISGLSMWGYPDIPSGRRYA